MGAKILVADDSMTIQTAVHLTFGREDVELIPARSGEEAIRKAKEVAPDLMLIDTVMPDGSGYEVCRALKADPAMRDVPVILMTGTFEAVDSSEGQTVGANDFIAKPFESQALIKKVKQLLIARPSRLAMPADMESEVAVMEVEARAAQFAEAGPLPLEEEPVFAGSLTPPAIPPPFTDQESPAPSSEARTVAAGPLPVVVPVEIPQHTLERAVTDTAEQVVNRLAKEVAEKLGERIERIVREVVPALAESLIVKEIERIKASIEGKAAE
jgi:CheY-like chemotaxis protein